MKNKNRFIWCGFVGILFLALAWSCGSRPTTKVISLVRTEETAVERAAEGKVLLVVEVDAGRDIGEISSATLFAQGKSMSHRDLGQDQALMELLNSYRLTDNDSADFGNSGYEYDKQKNPTRIKLWWNVPRGKRAFVLVCGRQRISLDAPREVEPAPAPPTTEPGPEEKGVLGGDPGYSEETVKRLIEAQGGDNDKPIRVTESMEKPTLLKKVDPAYPEVAKQARVQGAVILEVTTNAEGRVRDAKVLSGSPLLTSAALDAVRHWVYAPSLMASCGRRFSK